MGLRLKIVCFFMGWVGLLFGQNASLKFRNYGIKEGLSQSTITSIFQDKKGFLWFGTSDGLNQFDGYKFKVYKNNYLNTNSLSDSWVNQIFEDSDNDLWIFTSDGTINVLDLHTQKITRFIPGKSELLNFPTCDYILFVREDQHKNVWISTNSGICRYNKPSKKFSLYPKVPANQSKSKRNFILYMIEDAKGSLWFAGHNGLYRYHDETDTFEQYSTQTGGLLSDSILSFEADKSHRLWALTTKGLNLYHPENNTFSSYPIPHKISYDEYALWIPTIIDHLGFIWIGTAKGLYRFNTKSVNYDYYENKPGVKGTLSNNTVTSILEDKSGCLWIGTSKGLNKYCPVSNIFENYYSNWNADNNVIANIIEDKNGDILTVGKLQLQHSNGGYLSYLNKGTGVLEVQLNDKCNPNSIASSIVNHPFTDKSGNIWLCSFGDGVVQYVPRNKMFEHYPSLSGSLNSPGGNSVWGFAEDGLGNIWIPVFDKGLDKFNPRTKEFEHFKPGVKNGLPGNIILFGITAGKNDDLWLATEGSGFIRFNTKSGKFKQYFNNTNPFTNNFVRKIVLDPSGKLWIGHAISGLDYFDPVTGNITHFENNPTNSNSLANNNIWGLMQDKSGDLWISSDGFIDRYNPSSGKFTHYKSKNTDFTGILANRALCIFEDKLGHIWFGTAGGGLSLFEKQTNKFRHWTETEGLPNNVIYGIQEDEQGYLWLSTNKGLSRFDVKRNKFKNYDANDGLQSNEFNMESCFKSRDNKLYFGGLNGFNSFYAENIKTDTVVPQTMITGIQVFNKEVQVVPSGKQKLIDSRYPSKIINENKLFYLPKSITYSDEITLTYHEKIFTIEYAGLFFKSPENTKYRYRMNNFDPDWNYAGNRRFATYTNLPHGEYTFEVTAANPDGIWNSKPTILKIRVLPPFWRTWWFLLFECFFIFGAIMLVIKLRLKSLNHAKAELEKKVNVRTHEIKEKNEELELRNLQILKQKEEIAFQAQQLKTELTIQNQTSEMALLRSQINPHFLFNTLNNIYSLVYQRSDEAPEAVMKLSEIMRYMLYEATSEKVLLQNEVNYLKSFIELQLLRLKNREFVSFNTTGNINGRTISPMLFIAFVENAFKHGEKRGSNPGITINLDVNHNKINFEVINYCRKNGTSNKDDTGGIGLANIKRRLELLHPNKFMLDILNNEEIYKVKLQINE